MRVAHPSGVLPAAYRTEIPRTVLHGVVGGAFAAFQRDASAVLVELDWPPVLFSSRLRELRVFLEGLLEEMRVAGDPILGTAHPAHLLGTDLEVVVRMAEGALLLIGLAGLVQVRGLQRRRAGRAL